MVFFSKRRGRFKLKKFTKRAKAFICVRKTKNNMFVTLTNRKGDVLYKYSAGRIGKGGAQKSSPNFAERAAKFLAQEAVTRGYNQVFLKVNGPFFGPTKGAIIGLQKGRVKFVKLQQVCIEAHNGVRAKKARRK